MHLVRTRPFRLNHDVEALLETLPLPTAPGFGIREARWTRRPWTPRIDVIETDEALVSRFELAGFRLEDLEVTLDNNLLTIKGTRSSDAPEGAVYRVRELADGDFSRSIRVSDDFDADGVEAGFSNGILEVVVPKRPQVLPRTVRITERNS